MGFVLRRSLPSLGGLAALLFGFGVAAAIYADLPMWFPVAFVVALLAVQFAVNPLLIQWLVPATVIEHDGERYLTEHPVGELVARRCRDAGIPLVKLGIVDDGTPNAFTFGRTPRDARIWLTRGLIERLDERELDAVVSHEIGHIRHWDFAVMTLAAVVPMVLYLVYITTRGRNDQAKFVAIGAYAAYLVSQFTLLALSRAREYAADHWSCECTGDGDALASALVKVAYGMGQANASHKMEVNALIEAGKEGKKEAAKLEARARRAQSMRAMGIFEPRQADAMAAAFAQGIDPERAVAALRWDVVNPWGRVLEKMSSHPLVARRIEALERGDLPGRPTTWSVLRSVAGVPGDDVARARAGFAREATVAVAPWAVLLPVAMFGAFTGELATVGAALALAGALFFYKQLVRYPTDDFVPVEELTSLLERLDAGPVAGIAVELRGEVIGRGTPGYVLSPDLVIRDQSGFVPLLYRQPVPFAAAFFGLFRAPAWLGQEVVARGWYRRMPGPVVELREVTRADGSKRTRAFEWIARYAASGVVLGLGIVLMLVGLSS